MHIVFDVDGTLLGGEAQDWGTFEAAIKTVVGGGAPPGFITGLPEVNAASIADAGVRLAGRETGQGLEAQIRAAYIRELISVHAENAQAFRARPAVKELLPLLRTTPGVTVSISTGDWKEAILFKLGAAEIDVSGIPMATASDRAKRAEIIALSIERAGKTKDETIYVGDGVWDFRACRALGIPFLGTGARVQKLRDAGAERTLEILEANAFLAHVREIEAERRGHASRATAAG